MKKKNRKDIYFWIKGVGVIIIVILFLLSLLFNWSSSEPHFKIYKEECRNESHKDWIDTNISICNKYLFNGESMQCYNESESEFKCDEEKCVFTLIEKTEYGWNYYGYIEIIDMSDKNISWNELVRVYEEICEPVEFDKNKFIKEWYNFSDGVLIDSLRLTTEWLNENCECIQIDCEYIFNASKKERFKVEDSEKFIGKTYEGVIWFTIDERGHKIAEFYQGDVELIEKCNPCQKYKCGGYFVETWNQIK